MRPRRAAGRSGVGSRRRRLLRRCRGARGRDDLSSVGCTRGRPRGHERRWRDGHPAAHHCGGHGIRTPTIGSGPHDESLSGRNDGRATHATRCARQAPRRTGAAVLASAGELPWRRVPNQARVGVRRSDGLAYSSVRAQPASWKRRDGADFEGRPNWQADQLPHTQASTATSAGHVPPAGRDSGVEVPSRLIVAMLLTGGVAFSGALGVSSLARDGNAPAPSLGVPPVPVSLESSTRKALSLERTARLPALASRRRRPRREPQAVSAPSFAPAPSPAAPPAPAPPASAPPSATPAPTAPRPPAPEPPVDFHNSG